MNIPDYSQTLCPFCRKREICNKQRFKEKQRINIKTFKCDYYELDKEMCDEASRRANFLSFRQD